MSTLLSLAVIGFVCAGAAGTAAWFINRDNARIAAWPTAQAVVLTSEVRHTSAETADHRRQLAWIPYVEYRYSVGGQTYTSDRISNQVYREFAASPESPPPANIVGVVNRYPIGATVAIHYRPTSPAVASLEIDKAGTRIVSVIASACFLAGLGCLLAWLRTH